MDYCFPGESRVFVSNNNEKYWTTINELKKGDMVKSNFVLNNTNTNNNTTNTNNNTNANINNTNIPININNTNLNTNNNNTNTNTNNNTINNKNNLQVQVSTQELFVEVECVVIIKCDHQQAQLVKLNKINNCGKLSGEHMLVAPIIPLMSTEPGFKWIQPKFIGDVKCYSCEFLYCIIFKNNQRSTINVNNRIFGVVGNKMNDSVTVHPFFTGEVGIQFLKKMSGWNQGRITLSEKAILRDSNGVIQGLNPEFEIISRFN